MSKLIAYLPIEGSNFLPYKGEELLLKDFLLTDYPAELNHGFSAVANRDIESPAFVVEGLKMNALVFENGTFIRLKKLDGKQIDIKEDKEYSDKLISILNINI